MMKLDYNVADVRFALFMSEGDGLAGQLTQYEPFQISDGMQPYFSLSVSCAGELPPLEGWEETMCQKGDGSALRIGNWGDRICLRMSWSGRPAFVLLLSDDYRVGRLHIAEAPLLSLNTALKLQFMPSPIALPSDSCVTMW